MAARKTRIRFDEEASEPKDSPAVAGKPRRFRRLRMALVLATIAGLGWGGHLLWEQVAPEVIHRERYLLPAAAISVTPTPAWITVDVREQVIKHADLDRRLSIVDDEFLKEIKNAFALHPWVESVGKIEKSYPPAVQIELAYRKPIAAVESTLGDSRQGSRQAAQLLPVDRRGVHLPAADMPEVGLRYLPRILDIVGRPLPGQPWDDPRVAGALDLAEKLAADWERLYLAEILPSPRPEINGQHRYYLYDLITRGGTRIVWGASPQVSPPREATFEEKLARLKRCVRRTGPLNSVRGPKIVDVRNGERIIARTAKKEEPAEEETVTK